MKFPKILLLIVSVVFISCNDKKSSTFESLHPKEFEEKIKTTDHPQILDVRTPDEFESEHIDNAKNVNWNSDDFEAKAASYDKSKPVFVYCLSGGRSKKAAAKLKELGLELNQTEE